MQIEEACPIPAAQQLLAHVRERYDSIPAFCEARGLDRLKVARAIKGDLIRVDVDFAFAIEEATDGAVLAEAWRMDEDLRSELKRRRELRESERRATGTDGGR